MKTHYSYSGSQVVRVMLYQAARPNTCFSPGRALLSTTVKGSCHKTGRVNAYGCVHMKKCVGCLGSCRCVCVYVDSFAREVAFILCPFSAATWSESCERDTIPSSSRQRTLSAHRRVRERDPLCLYVNWGERNGHWPLRRKWRGAKHVYICLT